MSGLSIRAKYRHFRTICEQTAENSPTHSFFFKLMVIHAWCCDFVSSLSRFICKFEMSFHRFLRVPFHVIGPRKYCFCGSCCARLSATLQVFTPEWFLLALLVDWESLEMRMMNWVFLEVTVLHLLCCVFLCRGRRKSEWGRWCARSERQVREQQRVRHVRHQMTRLFSSAQRWHCNPCDLSQARGVRSALVNRLCSADVFCEWVSCPHAPSLFWNSFQETEVTTISQTM